MADLWQYAKADGDPDWSVGSTTFEHPWERAYDLLRFHRGSGFRIIDRHSGDKGPVRKLVDVHDPLRKQLMDSPGVYEVKSESDSYGIVFRRTIESDPLLGGKFLDVGRSFIGAPYKLGGTTPWGIDCSGLVIEESEPFGITYGLHKAYVMWQEFRSGQNGKITIPRSQILKGDLLVFHGGDHIATYIDDQFGGRVLDAQPHSVYSPWGFTPAGTHVRSMAPRYYCEWSAVEDVCRLVAVNGKP